MEHTENQIAIRGRLADLPRYSHESHGTRFLRFPLEVSRLSGAVDRIPVVAADCLMDPLTLTTGTTLHVQGQIRSHNVHAEDGRHLQIFLFASQIGEQEGPALNEVHLRGILCRDPILRRTPLGREICDLMLAVPRAYHRADYLPCILWGRTAQEAGRCQARDSLEIWGRFQSRNYTKLTDSGTETRTAYEISAMTARIPEDTD